MAEPAPVLLPDSLEEKCAGDVVELFSDVEGARFSGCLVRIVGSGISVSQSEFVGSRVMIESASGVVFADNVVRDYHVYETPAVTIGGCQDVAIRHNHVHGNAVGIGVGDSQGVLIEDNVFEGNYQHNALSLYKSSATVSGNVFRYNHPHGVLVHFVPDSGSASVSIAGNLFEMNVEDAINFEDWRDAADQSSISGNVIRRTSWAGINVEYNSWNAQLLISGNYVSESGYPLDDLPDSPLGAGAWSAGWEHGIKLEDCSGVIVAGNALVDNGGSGIDVSNCREVTLSDNVVISNCAGLRIGGPNDESYLRDVSPLQREDAGPSVVHCDGNDVHHNGEDYVGQPCE